MKSLSQLFIRLYDSFLFGNWLITFAGVLLTFSSIRSLKLEMSFQIPVLILIGAGIMLIYSVHAIAQNDALYSSVRKAWINRNRNLLIFYIGLAIFLILGALPSLNYRVLWIITPCCLVSLAYSFHIKVWGKVWGLREVPLLKVLIVAVVWSLVSVLSPLLQTNEYDELSVYRIVMLISIRFLLLLTLCLLFDVRDVIEDSNKGIRTFSSIAEIKKLKIICFIFLLIISLLSVIALETTFFHLFIFGAAASAFIVHTDKNQNDYFYNFSGDGLIILYSLAVIFSN